MIAIYKLILVDVSLYKLEVNKTTTVWITSLINLVLNYGLTVPLKKL